MKNKIIPYRKDLKEKARELRKHGTLAEVLLWQEIKGKQIKGFQFHRQVPMLDYIVDFYCHELALVIEIDGDSHYHDDAPIKDATRQKRIESYGINFLRFDDVDVKKNIGYVLSTIIEWIEDRQAPPLFNIPLTPFSPLLVLHPEDYIRRIPLLNRRCFGLSPKHDVTIFTVITWH